MADDSTKWCQHCLAKRPVGEFYRDRKAKDGLTVYCKAYYSAYYAKNKARQQETNRRAAIKRRYGLTVEEYDRLVAGGCSVCGEAQKRIVMDHCHATDSVRAPLCDGCNVALGAAYDSPEILRKLADYLERHSAA